MLNLPLPPQKCMESTCPQEPKSRILLEVWSIERSLKMYSVFYRFEVTFFLIFKRIYGHCRNV